MRLAIFSDVQANLEALEAVLAAIRRDAVDELVCLGDTVVYGADPDECCTLVRTHVSVCVSGNHDAAVVDRTDYSNYPDFVRHCIGVHKGLVSDENRAWLASLPFRVDREGMTFCHASPVHPERFEYMFLPYQIEDRKEHWGSFARATFIGHSHLCKSYAFGDHGDDVTEIHEESFVLDPDRRYVINVGSVGQPRDRDPRACYTIFDTESRAFQYKRVPYDVDRAARKILDLGLNEFFAFRLAAGC